MGNLNARLTLKSALQNNLGSNLASSGGRYFLYIVYNSENIVLDGYPCSINFKTDVIPAHWSCDRIEPPSNKWGTIFTLGLMQRIKLVPVDRNLSINSPSCFWNLLPTEMKLSLPFLVSAWPKYRKRSKLASSMSCSFQKRLTLFLDRAIEVGWLIMPKLNYETHFYLNITFNWK